MHVCTLDSEGVLLECSIGMKEAQHEDNWSWSTYCNLRMVYYNWTILTKKNCKYTNTHDIVKYAHSRFYNSDDHVFSYIWYINKGNLLRV